MSMFGMRSMTALSGVCNWAKFLGFASSIECAKSKAFNKEIMFRQFLFGESAPSTHQDQSGGHQHLPEFAPTSAELDADEKAFNKCVRAFANYEAHSLAAVAKKRQDFAKVSPALRGLLPRATAPAPAAAEATIQELPDSPPPAQAPNVFEDRLDRVEQCIRANAAFLRRMLAEMGHVDDGDDAGAADPRRQKRAMRAKSGADAKPPVLESDMDKVRAARQPTAVNPPSTRALGPLDAAPVCPRLVRRRRV
ncbi:hypothetical protein HDU83_000264 [Entophlyctis luteolus]|nr:hypothetical protein HDU83_000264 [Entophlyctis luteolus]